MNGNQNVIAIMSTLEKSAKFTITAITNMRSVLTTSSLTIYLYNEFLDSRKRYNEWYRLLRENQR